jgi:hypothetical protein
MCIFLAEPVVASAATIDDGYVTVDADAWLEARTGGEIESLTESLSRFIDHYRNQAGQAHHHVSCAVEAYVATVDPHGDDRHDIHMVNYEHTLTECLSVTTFDHPRYGACVVAYESSWSRTGVPRIYRDATMDSGYWYDYDLYEVCCPEGHGFTVNPRDVVDETGSPRTRDDLWPDGILTCVSDDPTHDDHDWHGSYAILCPTCAGCCSVDMPRF